jgi:hypothetical protein
MVFDWAVSRDDGSHDCFLFCTNKVRCALRHVPRDRSLFYLRHDIRPDAAQSFQFNRKIRIEPLRVSSQTSTTG